MEDAVAPLAQCQQVPTVMLAAGSLLKVVDLHAPPAV
jgi:hypothetical protein